MNETYTTIKIWLKTRRLLRKIAATTDESLVAAMDRLAVTEWKRLEKKHETPTGLQNQTSIE